MEKMVVWLIIVGAIAMTAYYNEKNDKESLTASVASLQSQVDDLNDKLSNMEDSNPNLSTE
jgi:hypothetical protein